MEVRVGVVLLLLVCVRSAVVDLFDEERTGKGTWHGAASIDGGHCSLTGTSNLPYDGTTAVAIDVGLYFDGAACGMCAEVYGPAVPNEGTNIGIDDKIPPDDQTMIVFVVDSCGGCNGGIGSGFDVYNPSGGSGEWILTWKAVDCPVGSQKLSYEFEGSTENFIKLQIRGHRIPIESVKITSPITADLVHTDDNHWQAGGLPSVTSDLTIEITAIDGQVLTDTVPYDGSQGEGTIFAGDGVQFDPYSPSDGDGGDGSDGGDGGDGDGSSASSLAPFF
eukprot:CAMPEP_0174257210 /NCGR_PEP_ID=MMETSP0439-20130205/6386_1 /TAXON_ID=0 /ORGANISM="Stereomyxa ramosa, Strain Chinc5" /LENGTH=276 /DNA_ID=CAMNT_0015340199 /DNA_START=1 /DNA_END=831 /DNA_ORIENTATION=-